MKILFLTEGRETPASRYRVEQFFPHFERAGIEPTIRGGYGPLYARLLGSNLAAPYKIATRARRALSALDCRSFDVVFWQRTAFPQNALTERLAARINPRVIFDFDDAVYRSQSGPSSWRERAFHGAVASASEVIAGNDHLASKTGAPEKTHVIPSVIDTDLYRPPESRGSGAGAIIGWMGTTGHFPFLEDVTPALVATLAQNPDARLRMVSNRVFEPLADHPQVDQIQWSADREIELLRSFDVGLMPLRDTPFTRGKCGFKMIQYMAVGCPVVVADVGVNASVLGDSDAGLLIDDTSGWEPAISRLLASRGEREERGRAGRERIVEAYSVRAVLPRYLDLFKSVASSRA